MRKRNNTITISLIILFVLISSFCAIIFKLSYISLAKEIDGVNLTEFVKNRNTETETLYAERGSIYSSDNELLAKNVNSYTVIAVLDANATKDINKPRHVIDKEDTATKLSLILNMNIDRLRTLLSKDLYQVELGPEGRGITEVTKKEIEKLNLPGIIFTSSTKRYYQMGSLAPYIIGFATSDDNTDDITGKMGIEQYYDSSLEGKDGYVIYQKDLYGYTIPNTTPIKVDAIPGKDIYLTIDSKIQMFLENAVADISSKNVMDWMTFSIINAKTGAVVASASSPTFNLNERNITNYLNPLTSYTYEPGSTMKIFSFMAAMENNLYNGKDTYKSGTIEIDDAVIQDFNGVGWGTITFDEGFAYSSNVAATNLALKMGRDKLYNFYDSLGFGKKTGITLPGELSGKINFKYRTEIATASFGQGITTTPIQNLQALTILTNDGVELEPFVVDKIVDSKTGKVEYKHHRKELGQKASIETVNKIKSLMYDVVYSGKTDAKFYKSDNITIIGKTGTAQISDGKGAYQTGKYDYIRSFAGIFPYDNPEYILYVSVKKFEGAYRDFAQTVTKVIEEVAKYKNIQDNKEKIDKSKIITIDNYISKPTNEVVETINSKGIHAILLGNGDYITNQYPKKNSKVVIGDKIFLTTNNERVIPNLTGYSENDCLTILKLLKVKYTINGNGRVTATSIPEGTVINDDTVIDVYLS